MGSRRTLRDRFRTRRQWRWVVLGGLLVIGVAFGPFQQRLAQWWYEQTKPMELPAPVDLDKPDDQTTSPPVSETDGQTSSKPELSSTNDQLSIPDSLNLAVPFTSQAPFANWDARHEEYCEEASALMVGRYFQGRGIDGPADADAAMGELEAWELEHFGYFESTTAAETAAMIRDVYGLTVTRATDVTVESIKTALAAGSLVVIPAAGRELGNPYFQRPGPIYHMLVVKGYTADGQFITNDPGTKRGADFVYDPDRLIGAIGDYHHGDPATGESVMLVVARP